MTIRVVTNDPMARQPDNRLTAEILLQQLLHLLSSHAGVTIWIQQAVFGCEQRARTVAFDGTAFEDKPRLNGRNTDSRRNLLRHLSIVIPGRVLSAPAL